MTGTASNLHSAFSEISRIARADGRGRIFAVSSGAEGVGASFIARQLALIAAQTGFDCCLMDMDLSANAQFAALSAPDMRQSLGPLEGPYDAGFGVEPFWRVSPCVVNAQGERESHAAFMGLYTTPNSKIGVTGFLWDKLQDGQSVHIAQAREYWYALRERYAITFLDVPSLARSETGSTVFGEVDGTIMVTDDANSPSNHALLQSVSEVGGKCVGAIINTYRAAPLYGDSA